MMQTNRKPRRADRLFGLLCLGALCVGAATGSCSSGGAPEGGGGARRDLRHGMVDDDEDFGVLVDLGSPPDLMPLVEPDWAKVAGYLDSLFEPGVGLVRSSPGSGEFWTATDNVLVAEAYKYLPMGNRARGEAIWAKLVLHKICGCDAQSEHDATMNHLHDPLVIKGAQTPTSPSGACSRAPQLVRAPGSVCSSTGSRCAGSGVVHEDHATWVGDDCNFGICGASGVSGWDASGPGRGSGKYLALQILNRKNRGMPTDVLWQSLALKWDGKGIFDSVANQEGRYQTATLALFKLVAQVLGKPLAMGVNEKLKEAQGSHGGIRASYGLDGSFSAEQTGNAETTALTVLAFRKPVTDY